MTSFFRRWLTLVALLHLPAIYVIAAMTTPHRLPVSAGLLALAPYALGAILVVSMLRSRGRR